MGGMGRWEPDTRDRLREAALELFERGYDNTTAAQIAARAGTAKSTFFRHFADKREVLFGGNDVAAERAVAAIAAAPPGSTTFELAEAALVEVAQAFPPERRAWCKRRQGVIDSNPELGERNLFKQRAQAEAITAALRTRGFEGLAAELAGAVIGLALNASYTRWMDDPEGRDVATVSGLVLTELRAGAGLLSQDAPARAG